MNLRSVLPVQLRPARLISTVEYEGQEWCLIRDNGNDYWTPYAGGKLVPAVDWLRADDLLDELKNALAFAAQDFGYRLNYSTVEIPAYAERIPRSAAERAAACA